MDTLTAFDRDMETN